MTLGAHRQSDQLLRELGQGAVERARASLIPFGQYALGPYGFSVRGVDHPTLRQMMRHLLPLDAGTSTLLEIDVIDGRSGAGFPPAWNLSHSDIRHLERLHLSYDCSLAVQYDDQVRSWTILDRNANRGLLWVEDLGQLPPWDVAAPFRALLHWQLAPTDLAIVHAGAIVSERGATLLAGQGGSGKSTTVATALRAGLRVSGDDLIVAGRHDGVWQAFALYDTLKLEPSGVKRAGFALDQVENAEGKVAYRYSDTAPGHLVRAAPLVGIAETSVADQELTTLKGQTAASVLRALAPSTIFLLRGYEERTWAKLVALVRAVPSWSLRLGRDPDGVVDILRRLQ